LCNPVEFTTAGPRGLKKTKVTTQQADIEMVCGWTSTIQLAGPIAKRLCNSFLLTMARFSAMTDA
jgi:hypothetical protein